MKILTVLMVLETIWLLGTFIGYYFAKETKWFSKLSKPEKWFYAFGWPMFLPYYLYLRFKDRKWGK